MIETRPIIVAMSEWSKPVGATNGATFRARMIVSQEHSPAHAGPQKETAFYLEWDIRVGEDEAFNTETMTSANKTWVRNRPFAFHFQRFRIWSRRGILGT